MNWNGKRVLVTGAGGFIGSHLCEALRDRGADVTGFLRYTSDSDRGFLPDGVQEIRGDLQDLESVSWAMPGRPVVFHLGAMISVPYSIERPLEAMSTNAIGTANVLLAAKEYGLERVIVMSTSEVYGSAQYTPMDEKHPKCPQSPYAASKIAADAMAMAFHAAYNLPVTVVRPFNTFGPRQSQRAVIPAMIAQLLWRDSVKVGNLDTRRDFTFVSDTVQGLIAAAESDATIGQEVNLGTGHSWAIGEVLAMLKSLMDDSKPVECDSQRVRWSGAEVTELRSNPRKAAALMGWKAQVSLKDGLALTVEYIRAHPELYDPERYRI